MYRQVWVQEKLADQIEKKRNLMKRKAGAAQTLDATGDAPMKRGKKGEKGKALENQQELDDLIAELKNDIIFKD